MRITNQMTMTRMLMNINRNARRVDTLYQQIATGKRIQVPSDNPIIASRALKFRTNISNTEQHMRNASQAISWMSVTQGGFTNSLDLMAGIRENLVLGATDTFTASDRNKIITEIRSFLEQLGDEMNVSYAGRHVFSGFRTDQPAILVQDHVRIPGNAEPQDLFLIRQTFNHNSLKETMSWIRNPADLTVSTYRITKIDLPYRELMDADGNVTRRVVLDPPEFVLNGVTWQIRTMDRDVGPAQNFPPPPTFGTPRPEPVGSPEYLEWVDDFNDWMMGEYADWYAEFTAWNANGYLEAPALPPAPAMVASGAAADAFVSDVGDFQAEAAVQAREWYMSRYSPAANEINFIPGTGELIFGSEVTAAIRADGGNNIDISYRLEGIRAGELNPLVYFDTVVLEADMELNPDIAWIDDGDGTMVPDPAHPDYPFTGMPRYTPTGDFSPLGPPNPINHFTMDGHEMRFEFGANTHVRINNLAMDVFTAGLYAELHNFINMIERAEITPIATMRAHFTPIVRAAVIEDLIAERVAEVAEELIADRIETWANDLVTTPGGPWEGYDADDPLVLEQANIAVQTEIAMGTFDPVALAQAQVDIEIANGDFDVEALADAAMLEQDQLDTIQRLAQDAIDLETQRFMDVMHTAFTSILARHDDHTATMLRENTTLGSRLTRLEMTRERLETNRLSLTALMSENEDVDYLEVIMQMTAMEAVYSASMMAGSRIQQMTLADFIR